VWSQKIFTCASAVKATIKTVSFDYNGTDENSLKNLHVTAIEDKVYKDQASMPLWGVEDTGNAFTSSEINLAWGIISPEYQINPNVSAFRQPALYLPGWIDPRGVFTRNGLDENLPGSDFSIAALGASYCVGTDPNSASCSNFQSNGGGLDYTGATNMAMWARWQNLTKNAEDAAIIPNLIWTDTAASGVVGTKGVLGPGNTAQYNLVALPVTPTVQKIRYHWPYAIPALLVALMLVLITFLALIVTCFKGVGIHRMRLHLHQTSPGRIYTNFLYPGPSVMTMRTREWGRHLGRKQIDFSGECSLAAEGTRAPEKEMGVTSYERSSDVHSAEGEIFMTPHNNRREILQGDSGYGLAPPQQYHNQYQGDLQQPPSPTPVGHQYQEV
jgi:hypothetical protein